MILAANSAHAEAPSDSLTVASAPDLNESRMHLNENLYVKISPARLPVSPTGLLRSYFDKSILKLSEFTLVGIAGNTPIPTAVVNGKISTLIEGKMWTLISCDFVMTNDPVNFPLWYVNDSHEAKCKYYPDAN